MPASPLLSAVIAVTAVLSGAILTPGPALAAEDDGGFTVQERISDCNFNLDWPHDSHHNPGRANSNAVIKCDSPKKYLGLQVRLLERTGGGHLAQVGYGEYVNNSGTGRTISKAATSDSCHSESQYLAEASFLVVEQNDNRIDPEHKTPLVSVSC